MFGGVAGWRQSSTTFKESRPLGLEVRADKRKPNQLPSMLSNVPLQSNEHGVVFGNHSNASTSLLNCLGGILHLIQTALWREGRRIGVIHVSVHGWYLSVEHFSTFEETLTQTLAVKRQ